MPNKTSQRPTMSISHFSNELCILLLRQYQAHPLAESIGLLVFCFLVCLQLCALQKQPLDQVCPLLMREVALNRQ